MVLRGLGRQRKRARVRGDRETEMLATALACSIVGFCAAATFTSHFTSEYFWAILSVAGAFLAQRKHVEREQELELSEPATETAPPPHSPAAA